MLRTRQDGLSYYHFENLAQHPNVIQAIFTRHGGVSLAPIASLNVGGSVGDDPSAVVLNHRLIYEALGVAPGSVVTAHQIHGSHVAVARKEDAGRLLPNTDSIVTDVPGLVLMLRFADCVPVLLYDLIHQAIGLVHAGWRGIAQGIILQTLLRMSEVYNTRAEDIIAGIGPSIGPCCYEVGPEVVTQVGNTCGGSDGLFHKLSNGSLHLDLWESSRCQLMKEGVRRIEIAALCTSCNVDEFYSHRAEGGRTGRFPALLGLQGKAEVN